MNFNTLDDHILAGKRILLRVDLNVPMNNQIVSDSSRIERIVPTIKKIISEGGKPVLVSHFGRPNGTIVKTMSLKHIVKSLAAALKSPLKFHEGLINTEAIDATLNLEQGTTLLLENTRFYPGEELNDKILSHQLQRLGDIYCNDAFSVSHRAHSSTVGVAKLLPNCAGLLMTEELDNLNNILTNATHPLVAVIGGAKISTKLELISNLIKKVDHLVIGGGMANTFLAAEGFTVGKSLCENNMLTIAKATIDSARMNNCKIHLPLDIVVSERFESHADTKIFPFSHCPDNGIILDVGPNTIKAVKNVFSKCKTLVWNGPLGAFETPPFQVATVETTRYAAHLTKEKKLVSVAGGGDTLAALKMAEAYQDFTYVSTAGGAFLEWMEGKSLPGIECLIS